MSLLDNVRQTLEQTARQAATRAGQAASTAREVGQNLSAQAQAQLNIKKLQLEQAKTLRDLGERTYEWYQSGQMIVSGPVPDDVRHLCAQLDDTSARLRVEESRLEDARRQAELRGKGESEPDTYTILPSTNTSQTLNDAKESATMTTSAHISNHSEKSTQKLSADGASSESVASSGIASGGVTMPGTGIITNPTPPASDPETLPPAVPNIPTPDASPSPLPSSDSPIPTPAPDNIGGGGTGMGTGIGVPGPASPGSIPGGTF